MCGRGCGASVGRIPYTVLFPCPVSTLIGWLLFLVLCAVGATVAVRVRRSLPPPPAPPDTLGDPDDLDRLGLSAARPATSRREAPRVEPVARQPEPWKSETPHEAARPREAEPPGGVRMGEEAPWNGRSVPLLLGSLSAHARGPVAVVRREDDGYRIVARTDGGPLTRVRAAPLSLDGPTDLGAGALGGLAALVGGAARVTPLGDLLVLVGGDGTATDAYLDLLAVLTPTTVVARPPSTDARAETGPGGSPDEASPDAPVASGPVPRAVLIAEEQESARAAGQPLAFALVTLADAEERLTRDDPAGVAAAESSLRLRLEAADGVRRVEPFGDLLFGAFLERDPQGTAAWCDALSAADPPLFIGAVAPADGEPRAVRDAAAEALRDAYDRRGARIVAA